MIQIFLLSFLCLNLSAQDQNLARNEFNPLWKKSKPRKVATSTSTEIENKTNASNDKKSIDFGPFGERIENNPPDTDPLDEFLKINADKDSEENSPFVFGQNYNTNTRKTESRQKLRSLLDEFLISQRKLKYEKLVSLPKPARLDEIQKFTLNFYC